MDSVESYKLARECNSLDNISLLLIGQGLITEVERRIIAGNNALQGKHAAICQILGEKPPSDVRRILKILKDYHSSGYLIFDLSECEILDSHNDVNSIQNCDPKNALLNNVVIKHVFQYLDVESFLRCRSVCRKWNDVADPILRNVVRINLDSLQPDTFIKIFKHSMDTLPFSSFMFSNIENLPTPATSTALSTTSTIKYFFENWKKNIKEISWKDTMIKEGGEKIDRYDISQWINMSENLVELNIWGSDETTEIQICLSSLQKVKRLELRECRVLLDKSVKIAPFRLNLTEITFFSLSDSAEEGTPPGSESVALNEIYLNDIVDFTHVKQINLANIENSPATLLKLNVGKEVVKMNKVKLHRIFISTWMDDLNWEFDSLCLHESPPATKMEVKVNELVVDLTNIDFSLLPESIQKLSIFRYKGTNFTCSQPLSLLNLKHLFVDIDAQDLGIEFYYFLRSLNKLEEITLVDISGSLKTPLIIDPDLLPNSVKTMKFNCPVVALTPEKILNLDKLILDRLTLSQAHDILKFLMPKVLILRWEKQNTFEINDSFLLFLRSNPEVEQIIVGDFDWSFLGFSENHISQYVDKQSKYYQFSNGVGTAISHDKFYGFMKLYSGAFYNDCD